MANFNSIKVRLKRIDPAVGAAAITAFQFHKGTIKTAKIDFNNLKNENFNSIKVRLKRC